jgi:hypothetical protein
VMGGIERLPLGGGTAGGKTVHDATSRESGQNAEIGPPPSATQ